MTTGDVPSGVTLHSKDQCVAASCQDEVLQTVTGSECVGTALTGRQAIRGGEVPWPALAVIAAVPNGLAVRSVAADAHRCIMVGLHWQAHRIQGCGAMFAPDGELHSDRPGPDCHLAAYADLRSSVRQEMARMNARSISEA